MSESEQGDCWQGVAQIVKSGQRCMVCVLCVLHHRLGWLPRGCQEKDSEAVHRLFGDFCKPSLKLKPALRSKLCISSQSRCCVAYASSAHLRCSTEKGSHCRTTLLGQKKGIGRFGPTAHADDIPQEVDAVSHLGATGSLLETSTERLKRTQRSTTKIRLAPQKKKSKVLTRLD